MIRCRPPYPITGRSTVAAITSGGAEGGSRTAQLLEVIRSSNRRYPNREGPARLFRVLWLQLRHLVIGNKRERDSAGEQQDRQPTPYPHSLGGLVGGR